MASLARRDSACSRAPPGLFGGLLRLGQQLLQISVQLRQLFIQLRNPGLLLLGLANQTACPAVRLLQLQLGPGNVLLIMGDGTLQHRNGGFLLLDLSVQSGSLTAAALRLHILALHLLAELFALGIQGHPRADRRHPARPGRHRNPPGASGCPP